MQEPGRESPYSFELWSPSNGDEHAECQSKRKGPPIEEHVDNVKKRQKQMRTWLSFEPSSPSLFSTNNGTTGDSVEDTSLSRINGSSSDQPLVISVRKEFRVSQSLSPPVPPTIPTSMSSETSQPKKWILLLKARLGQVLNRIGLSLLTSDDGQLLTTNDLSLEYGHSEATIAIIEDAASFLSGLFIFDQAFPLYYALLEKRKDVSAEAIRILMKCARFATRLEDVQLVQELVAAYQCQRATPGWSFPELLWLGVTTASQEKPFNPSHKRFLATLLPSDVEAFQSQFQKGGNIVQDILESKIFDYEQMRQLFQDLGTWTSVEWETFFGDDLAVMRHVTSCCNGALELFDLMYASRVSGQSISDTQWTDIHSILQRPETRNGRVSIRNLAEWCAGKLACASKLPKRWRSIRRRSADRRWEEFCAIYWYLWQQWEMQRRSHDISSSTLWMYDLELTMGTSSAQLLSAMASLILKWSSDNRSIARKMRHYLDPDTALIQRATSGSTALLQQTDERLAKSFLGHFLDGKRTAEPPVHQSEMRTFQQAAAQFFLDTSRRTHSLREHLQPSPLDAAVVSEDSPGSEIASTYTSSSMSSMRRLTLKGMRAPMQRSEGSWSNRTPSMDDLSESVNLMSFEGGDSQSDSSHSPPEYTQTCATATAEHLMDVIVQA